MYNDLSTFTGRQAQLILDIRTFALYERAVDLDARINLSLAAHRAETDAALDDIRTEFAFIVAQAPRKEQI